MEKWETARDCFMTQEKVFHARESNITTMYGYYITRKVFGNEMICGKLREIHRNLRNLGLGVRFKSCVMVQAPAQFGTHKNYPSKYSEFVTITQSSLYTHK